MNADEYAAITLRLGMIARATLDLDLDGYLKAIEDADSVGAMVDPTLYRCFLQDPKARANLRASKEIATALKLVRAEAVKLAEAMGAERFFLTSLPSRCTTIDVKPLSAAAVGGE